MGRVSIFALIGLIGTTVSAAEEAPSRAKAVREGIEAIEARLDRAVDKVSLPQAARLVGRIEGTRGYRLPGYGVVFVLTPRSLPSPEKNVFVLRTEGPHHRVLRVETRSHKSDGGSADADHGGEEEEIDALERQVLVLQAETEEARRAAEEEMDRLVVRVRTAAAHEHETEGAAGDAAAPPAPPAPPSPPEPALPPPPPWKFWFGAGIPHDDRTPDAVVADVRAAVIDALAPPGELVPDLGGAEQVTVAIDFVPGGLFLAPTRPERTLVLRARVKDLDARSRGSITPEELRRRVEVVEY
jgi:hypothetical protein